MPLILFALGAVAAQAQMVRPAGAPRGPGVTTPAAVPGRTAPAAKIPVYWLDKAKGYEKALAIQKETGADIFLYFSRDYPTSEKGLCNWFENKRLTDQKVKNFLKGYIRVQVPLPSNPDSQKLAEEFDVRRCPAVFIIQPNGMRQYCKVIDWSEGKPEPFPPEDLIQIFQVRSTQPTGTTNSPAPASPAR